MAQVCTQVPEVITLGGSQINLMVYENLIMQERKNPERKKNKTKQTHLASEESELCLH